MGVFKDKEYETIIDQMSVFDADVITVETPGNPRALPAEELAEAWKKKKADVINDLRTEMFLDAENTLKEHINDHIFYLEEPTGAGKSNTALNLSLSLIHI